MEEWQDFSFLLISYPKPRSVFTEKVRNTVRHDGELIKKKLIGGDANDFYNNVILADDVFIVVDRKKRDMNALSPKKRKAAEQKKEQEKKQNEIRLAKLKENIEAYRLENSPVGNDKE